MQEKEFKALLSRYENGTASAEEKAFIEDWYLQYHHQKESGYSLKEKASDANDLWNNLQPVIQSKPVRPLWPRITVAASILLFLSVGTYVMFNRQSETAAHDISPFTGVAILKSGGKTILLDQMANGKIAQTTITKSAGEQLSYARGNKSSQVAYDTIQIPAGGKPYTVKLSDGSKITLNAATTLRYPQAFSKNRKEEIELLHGEIYAEVVHNAAAPMQIKAPGQVITDIGTEFDIAAYADEPDSRTTLISGSVKVNAAGQEKTLSPGQQTILRPGSLTEGPANIDQVTSWKDGLFRFKGERIQAVMRQLARWYNIEVVYQGKVTDEAFYGVVDRKRKISEVLSILERSQKVHFKVEGRRVTVLSK